MDRYPACDPSYDEDYAETMRAERAERMAEEDAADAEAYAVRLYAATIGAQVVPVAKPKRKRRLAWDHFDELTGEKFLSEWAKA